MREHKMAAMIKVATCKDPKCGPHILMCDGQEHILCEGVLSEQQALLLIKDIRSVLYHNAVMRDDG